MITIISGVPGAGKTLYTVSELRKEYADRDVYYFNIPGISIPEWKELKDPLEWHSLPPGSVCIVDEAHEVFPKRDYRQSEPPHIEAAATLRHRGHDLVLITQHPVDLDIFLRRRCARFLFLKKPLSKADYATVYMWGEYVDDFRDEKVQLKADNFQFKYPAESFDLYKSAQLHTGKKYVPKALKKGIAILAVAVFAFVGAAYYLYDSLTTKATTMVEKESPSLLNKASGVPAVVDYAEYYKPKIPGLPWTAPFYADLAKAQTYPRLNCVANADRCQCYSQQATRIDTPESVCRAAVREGVFDFGKKEGGNEDRTREPRNRVGA